MADEPLSTTILNEELVCYKLFEEGSKRGKPLLVGSDGFKYSIKRNQKNSVLWTCSARSVKCKCYAIVIQKGGEYIRGPNSHQHAPDPSLLTNVKVKVQVTKEAKRHVYQSATELVNIAIKENFQPNNPRLPIPDSVATAASRYRSKFRPAQPKDLEFVVDSEFLSDIRYGDARHLIFATEEQLQMLSSAKRWFMDGTFKVVGEPFSSGQLTSIHGFVTKDGFEKQVPMVFVLMSRKRTQDYVMVLLTEIRDALENVVVENFVLDFEQAAWLAVKEVFPGVTIKGCVFHFTQAVWRKVQDLGLKPLYMERASVYQYVRQMMALPFLPSTHIEPAFRQLAGRANTGQLSILVNYMDAQWMNHAIFNIQSWSVFGITIRTNNDVEGWHHRLNRQAGHQSLSFYRLILALRSEAELVSYELRLIRDSVSTRRIRPRYKEIELRVREFWTAYLDNEMSISELLNKCAKVYGPQCEDNDMINEETLVT